MKNPGITNSQYIGNFNIKKNRINESINLIDKKGLDICKCL